MATTGVPSQETRRPTSGEVRAGAQRIREIGRSAAAHAGNAAALLRLAASTREQARRRR
jgi:hypothetical protein